MSDDAAALRLAQAFNAEIVRQIVALMQTARERGVPNVPTLVRVCEEMIRSSYKAAIEGEDMAVVDNLRSAFQTEGPLPCPKGTSQLLWDGACALAQARHPNARYPQPRDLEDARIVLRATIGVPL